MDSRTQGAMALSDAPPGWPATPNQTTGRDGIHALESERYRLAAYGLIGLLTLARFASVAQLPLGNGEAYYASWARFLDYSYYDHPPLLAWMVRASTALSLSEATVRLGPIVCSTVFGLLFHRLANRLFGARAAFYALVLVSALPVFLVSSFVVNPEAPLAPLWVAFLLTIDGMRTGREPYRPLLAGTFLGLAFLAKYTAVALVPATLLYMALSKPARTWFKRPSFYAGSALALALTLPVIVWNHVRDWPSIRLHFVERAAVSVPVAGENTINHLVEVSSSDGSGLVQSVARVLVGQLMSYSPLLFPLLVLALVLAVKKARRDDRFLFLAAFSVPILLPLLAVMVRLKDAEQHWTMVAMIPLAIGAGYYADMGLGSKWVRILGALGFGASMLVFVGVNVHARTTLLFRRFGASYDPRADMVNELVGWDQVRAAISRVAKATDGKVVLGSNHYSLCGRLMFEMGDQPNVFCPARRRSAFDFWDRALPPDDATVLVLTSEIHPEQPDRLVGRTCAKAEEVTVRRDGRPVANYVIHSCAPLAPRVAINGEP